MDASRTQQGGEGARIDERVYRSLFEQSLDAFLVARAPELVVIEANPAAAKLFACARLELAGRCVSELAPPLQADGRRSDAVLAEQVAAARREGVARFVWRAFGEKRRLLEIEATVLPASSLPSPDLVLVCLHDVTRQRALEEKLRQSQRLEAIGMLAGGIAHDFNNVLTGVNGFLELALERLPEQGGDRKIEGARKCVGEARRAANRAVELTRHLLAFGRRSAPHKNVFDLNDSVSKTASLIRRLIGETIELDLDLTPKGCLLRGDAGEMEQALLNLAINARDAMPQGGRLRIATIPYRAEVIEADAIGLPAGEYAVLEVSDSGTGMTDSVKVRLFEPFFTTKDVGQGTGLGLAVVNNVVASHGGKIFVDSAPGEGTAVRIILPVVSGAPRAPAQGDPGPRPLVRGSGLVLVVDDDPMVREVTAAMLETLGYRVRKAGSAAEALEDVTQELPDLVLTDVVMPEVSGVELERRLRREFPRLPVLLVSGYAKDAFARHGVDERAAALLLPKPVTLETLGTRVQEMLSAARV